MPLRKRIGIMGVGCWSALRGSNPPLCAMLRNVLPMHHRHNKPLPRLIRRTRGELSTLRLLQAYAYIIPCFSAPKLAKFQKKKVGRSHDQLSNLCSQLLIAHNTYKTILTRQLRREVQELRADTIDRALVHPVLLPRPHCCMPIVVVPHRPSFVWIAILIRALDYLQPPLRPPQRPAVIQRDCFQLHRQPHCLLCSRITHKRMTAAPTAMAARLQPRFFHSSLDAVLIAQNFSNKLVCVLSDLIHRLTSPPQFHKSISRVRLCRVNRKDSFRDRLA